MPNTLLQSSNPLLRRGRFAPLREAYALPGNRGVEPPEIAQRLKGLFR